MRLFTEELDKRAKDQGLILIRKSSFVAGGEDITDEAAILLNQFMEQQ